MNKCKHCGRSLIELIESDAAFRAQAASAIGRINVAKRKRARTLTTEQAIEMNKKRWSQ